MTNFKSTESYDQYLQELSYDQLVDISLKIDKDRYPDRYDLVLEYISSVHPESITY